MRARTDPEFAKMVRVRQLGPEQLENQKHIRASMESVRARLEELEDHLAVLKEKVVEAKLGKSSLKAPSLDSISRAIRNITVAVTEKMFEIDELALRLDMMRVSLDSPAPHARKARVRPVTVDDTLSSSILRMSPAAKKAASPDMHPDVVAAARAALNAERSAAVLKKALLAARTSPIVNKSVCEQSTTRSFTAAGMSDLQAAFSAGPITGDRLPLPRRPPPHPSALPDDSADVLSTPSTPPVDSSLLPGYTSPLVERQGTAQPSFGKGQEASDGLGGSSWTLPSVSSPFSSTPAAQSSSVPPPLTFKAPVSFSFASPVSADPAGSTSGGSARNRGGLSRTHSSAVQLRSSPGASSPSASTPSTSAGSASGFSFGDLPAMSKRDVEGFKPFSFANATDSRGGQTGLGSSTRDEGLEEISEGDE